MKKLYLHNDNACQHFISNIENEDEAKENKEKYWSTSATDLYNIPNKRVLAFRIGNNSNHWYIGNICLYDLIFKTFKKAIWDLAKGKYIK